METASQSKKIKGIHSLTFDVCLMERPSGRYYVESYKLGMTKPNETYDVRDLNMALALFNTIHRSLQGH